MPNKTTKIFHPHCAPNIKINPKRIINLNVKPNSMKPWKKTEEKNLHHLRLGKDFLDKRQTQLIQGRKQQMGLDQST